MTTDEVLVAATRGRAHAAALVALLGLGAGAGCHCVQGPGITLSQGSRPVVLVHAYVFEPDIGVHGEVIRTVEAIDDSGSVVATVPLDSTLSGPMTTLELL